VEPIHGAESILSALPKNLCMRCIFLAAYPAGLTINKAKCTFLARWAILAKLDARRVVLALLLSMGAISLKNEC